MITKFKNIIVKDYLFGGHYIFGTFYEIKKDKTGEEVIEYILDDGDIYTEDNLKESGYEYVFIDSDDIIDAFKHMFDEVKNANTSKEKR